VAEVAALKVTDVDSERMLLRVERGKGGRYRNAILHDAGRLAFFESLASLADWRAFLRHLSPVRHKRWVVYAKPPFAGPEAVLAYLSRYTHRVAILTATNKNPISPCQGARCLYPAILA
jgi:hypothetical protein